MKQYDSIHNIANFLFALAMTAIIAYLVGIFSLDNWPYLIGLFLILYPWRIGKDIYSLFGGANSSGSVGSLVSIFQIASENAVCIINLSLYQNAGQYAGAIIALPLYQNAGQGIRIMIGLPLYQNAGEYIRITIGASLYQRAGQDIYYMFGFPFIQKAGSGIYCGLVLPFYQRAGEDGVNYGVKELYHKLY